ncbi:nuclear transport factor 2 family protein [Xanthomonas sp. 3075]|uniref:nuclear transport factor 2 family protein n=1 Tax=Xanthomonas sp. 3075 TaxID=3035315 RepID=UPI00160F1DEA|nr:nuclear transport factor 2 family protein [Xanthomonas sp. 3075]MBB4130337.1 hypothetical protein [Xanthomonas sp. 3075]
MSETSLLTQLRALELRLLGPQVRSSVQALEELLDPEFVEFGASGRRDTRGDVIAALMADDALVDYRADGFECVLLVPHLAQLRYRSIDRRGGIERHALRSSLWRADGNGWRLLFHQGTAFTENAAS